MSKLPICFEISGSQPQDGFTLISQIRRELFQRGVQPLPLAGSLHELEAVLYQMERGGHEAGLFVVNVQGAEASLARLDELMRETPAIFFRREMLWLKEFRKEPSGGAGLTTRLDRMRPRLSACWPYGARNIPQVARRAAARIACFLRFGDFRRLEGSVRLDRIKPTCL